MADVVLDFDARVERFEREMQKVRAQNEKLIEDLNKLKNASKETAEGSASGFERMVGYADKQVGSIKNMVMGLVGGGGLLGAVNMVIDAHKSWYEWLNKLDEKQVGTAQRLTGIAAISGDYKNLPKIEAARRGAMTLSTGQDFEALLTGVRMSSPTMDIDRQLAVARSAARAAPMGGDLQGLGGLSGLIARQYSDVSPGQAANLAFLMRSRVGKALPQLQSDEFFRGVAQLESTGAVSRDEAWGMGITLMQHEAPVEVLSKIAKGVQEIQEPIQQKRKGSFKVPLTDAEKEFNAFAAADPKTRLQMLMKSQALQEKVTGKAWMNVRQLAGLPAEMAQNQQLFAQGMRGNAIGDALGAYRGTASGGIALDEYSDTMAREQADSQFKVQAGIWKEVEDTLELRARRSGTMGFYNMPGVGVRALMGAMRAGGNTPVEVLKKLGVSDEGVQEFIQGIGGRHGQAGIETLRGMEAGSYSLTGGPGVDMIVKAIDKQTETMKQLNQSHAPNAAQGQINVHTEAPQGSRQRKP